MSRSFFEYDTPLKETSKEHSKNKGEKEPGMPSELLLTFDFCIFLR